AKNAGMNLNIHATPSVALGAYEVTPIEMAGAYTVFANEGVYVKPNFISMVRARNNATIYKYNPESHPALDPRVAYMMVNLLGHARIEGGMAFGIVLVNGRVDPRVAYMMVNLLEEVTRTG